VSLEITTDVVMSVSVMILIVERGWSIIRASREKEPDSDKETVREPSNGKITFEQLQTHCNMQQGRCIPDIKAIRNDIGNLHEKMNTMHFDIKDRLSDHTKRIAVIESRQL
jgi:hypothetical protein